MEVKKGQTQKKELVLYCDPDKIRTCNLLIRNQVRYPVAPRGLIRIQIYNQICLLITNTDLIPDRI